MNSAARSSAMNYGKEFYTELILGSRCVGLGAIWIWIERKTLMGRASFVEPVSRLFEPTYQDRRRRISRRVYSLP